MTWTLIFRYEYAEILKIWEYNENRLCLDNRWYDNLSLHGRHKLKLIEIIYLSQRKHIKLIIFKMSFFVCFQPQNIPQNYQHQELLSMHETPNFFIPISNTPSYPTQSYFYPSNYTMNASSVAFTDFPCIPSQQDFSIPTSHSLPPIIKPQENR